MEEPYALPIGKNIKRFRVERKISQAKLGKAIGVCSQQISNYEIGARGIRVSKLYEISQVMNVPIEDFFRE
jgi:transcriptional regulator with XRE-family HTH domain